MKKEIGFLNLSLLDEMFEKWSLDPLSVDSSWSNLFAGSEPHSRVKAPETVRNNSEILQLIEAYRSFGHLKAQLSPIHPLKDKNPVELALKTYGFSEDDLDKEFEAFGVVRSLREIVAHLESIYCQKVGVEYVGLVTPEIEAWLQKRIEESGFYPHLDVDQKKHILEHLNRSELFENFLHTRYPGQKRFSLEGSETLIPVIAGIIEKGSTLGIKEFHIGMAHRGRLNLLCNIMGKTYGEVFKEFKEGYIPKHFEGSGDVKYHKGYTQKNETITICLADNPSHLESVYPVVEGIVRARQDKIGTEKVIPLLIHGDAAISGQGIIYETMQFSHLEGYQAGGSVHVVLNNEIGFTTLPEEGRSTRYCTDIAKAFGAPVFHVNGEDPEAALFVANLAVEMRQFFHVDVFIDLIGFRKYGHNESDEPFFTQPIEYQKIKKKKSPRVIYREKLIEEGSLEKKDVDSFEETFKDSLQKAMDTDFNEKMERKNSQTENVKTSVKKEILIKIAEKLEAFPEAFHPHKKIQNLYKERLEMAHDLKPIDWGMAETLAYGSLLVEGLSIRFSGQDISRGTFSHRQAVVIDQKVKQKYIPLNHIQDDQGKLALYNSPLSEFAVLGFDFGYSLGSPETLVIWEAQFGDFANGAQVIIDQYLTTSAQKWGKHSGLVLLLPHGYEGQGPEHSSARIERFLSLAGKNNITVVNPTTPAQIFHLLRRQALKKIKKPLIVFTPKGLLRHPKCVSEVRDLTHGTFQPIIGVVPPKAEKIVFCSGRIYYDLVPLISEDMALIRIEEIYPFPKKEIASLFKKGTSKGIFWVQEEPQNMGAFWYIDQEFKKVIPKGCKIQYVGRERSASPAAGSLALHQQELKKILEALFKEVT
ncbi:2-oxoglutarate dehydrogenase E1 component [Chlamydiales bacterium]|nr:2-oxoglutarate dehydrogenase E1 component [Chlamydiales bacterium]